MAWKGVVASNVLELRVLLSQTGPSSKGLRDFISKSYVELKKANPKLPILIRECEGIEPAVVARFEQGKERKITLSDLTMEQIVGKMKELTLAK